MKYKFTTKESYEYLSSGSILYNAPGMSAFPVRLASEIAMRCFAILESKGVSAPYSLYDPCCGGGYLLTSIGFLHGVKLAKIIASDIDDNALILAAKNLELLNKDNLNKRIDELKNLATNYNKLSHKMAIENSTKLLELINNKNHLITTDCFKSDVTEISNHKFAADIIITDFPYGDLTVWQSKHSNVIEAFFSNIKNYMRPNLSVVAVITGNTQKLNVQNFTRIERFKIGKRQISFFTLNSK
jgi:methylase of polypeptide subunit release factors